MNQGKSKKRLISIVAFMGCLLSIAILGTFTDISHSVKAAYAGLAEAQTPTDGSPAAAGTVTMEQAVKSMTDEIRALKAKGTPELDEETIRKILERGKDTKDMAAQQIYYQKIMVAVLIVIAVGFPLVIWLLSRKRLLGLSGLSSEVTATILLVEERQAKLANILKDIQGEMDYMHSMSAPDLKNLIAQAEKYLKDNEQDLQKTGLPKGKPATKQ